MRGINHLRGDKSEIRSSKSETAMRAVSTSGLFCLRLLLLRLLPFSENLGELISDLRFAFGQIHRLAEGLRHINPARPVNFDRIAIRIAGINTHGIAVTDDAIDRHVVIDKCLTKIFHVFEGRAAERDLLENTYIAIVVAAGRKKNLMMFDGPVLGSHENSAPWAPIAHLQTKNIAIEGHRTFDIAHMDAHMAKGIDFRHTTSLGRRELLNTPTCAVNAGSVLSFTYRAQS